MVLTFTQTVLAIASGSVVGFSLGLVGGGGSILAVPLLVYVGRTGQSHIAIGTSAIAVCAERRFEPRDARAVREREVVLRWRLRGSRSCRCIPRFDSRQDDGRATAAGPIRCPDDGCRGLMLRGRAHVGDSSVTLSRQNLPKLLGLGLMAGMLSGFFGIGGGFLIVPALMLATGMPILNAVGSSLVSVTASG